MRLAQGQIRIVLANHSARSDLAAERPGSSEIAARDASHDADDQDRHCATAAGASRAIETRERRVASILTRYLLSWGPVRPSGPQLPTLFLPGDKIMSNKPAVKPIPDGMHSLTPMLRCAGAADAIEFYKKAFNAVEVARLPGPGGKLMHAVVRIGDSALMLVDENPQWGLLGPKALKGSPVTVHLYVDNVDAVVAQAVAAGAKITMPVADAFWG